MLHGSTCSGLWSSRWRRLLSFLQNPQGWLAGRRPSPPLVLGWRNAASPPELSGSGSRGGACGECCRITAGLGEGPCGWAGQEGGLQLPAPGEQRQTSSGVSQIRPGWGRRPTSHGSSFLFSLSVSGVDAALSAPGVLLFAPLWTPRGMLRNCSPGE